MQQGVDELNFVSNHATVEVSTVWEQANKYLGLLSGMGNLLIIINELQQLNSNEL
jgi:hypothetical protein